MNKEKIEAFKMEPVTKPEFLFLGNSITEGFDLQKYFQKPWLNRGIGGNTTEAVLYRLDEVISREPENIVLMIGVNDISRGVEETEILDNYSAILKRLKSALPACKLYTLSVLPVRESYDLQRLAINTAYWMSFVRPLDINPKIVNLNEEIQKISAENGAIFFDIHAYYLDPDGDLHLNAELAYDNVHLNEKGYELLAQLLKERIVRI